MARRLLYAAGVLVLLALWPGTVRSAPFPARYISWRAPKDPLTLARRAGLVPERHETLIHHVHAHLDVFVNGVPVRVPAGIGINTHDPGVHRGAYGGGPTYGNILMCSHPCISPLHTHDITGILHTESASAVPHRLGQFFIEWGVRLTARCVNRYCSPATKVAVYINGTRYSGDPTQIQLLNHREMAIVIGKPPRFIPSTAVFP